ncbi:MAG TPA: [FeFe] hydrogenase H-cluster radical SAM maturase HydE [Candidatus Omnitrophota bacterium]|nr:[FeFe] hydrogenase H-cluster radical SAM maturase HydE [Candidatus Omnitrophota bacterium]HPT07475.1 [FeFe] hydrogenase H-cluster radical SAM maturase HydE [Candidatus Omnitrophota bacterium]
MSLSSVRVLLDAVSNAAIPKRDDLIRLLSLEKNDEQRELFCHADAVRKRFVGDEILLRGIVEFSNHCRNTCHYCGLNKNNLALKRYRMNADEILVSIEKLVASNVKTVVLQSGEEDDFDPSWLTAVIKRITRQFGIAITLSVGERSFDDYRSWRQAGADRYLLKIETTDKRLYTSLHPGLSFENRLQCLRWLKSLGYQTGSGIIVGLKGQTVAMIADDIIFFQRENFEMIGIGPFIPHAQTPLAGNAPGDVAVTLKTLALTRMVTKNTHLPATTALGSLDRDYRIEGLQAGANVIMPNFTPVQYRKLYEIYPGKKCVEEPEGACIRCMEVLAQSIGRTIRYSRGDGLQSLSEVKNV